MFASASTRMLQMIALSSFRPLDENPEYRTNQIAAFESWQHAFDHVVYFNKHDDRMRSEATTFLPREEWPTIKEMAEFAASIEGYWCAIVNADIVVSPDIDFVEQKLKAINAQCAVSSRYEFIPGNPVKAPAVIDNGLDFFAATPDVWRQFAKDVPAHFRIGHNTWDTFAIGWMNTHCDGFYDITPAKVIFHPRHSGRRQKYEMGNRLPDFALDKFNLPAKKVA